MQHARYGRGGTILPHPGYTTPLHDAPRCVLGVSAVLRCPVMKPWALFSLLSLGGETLASRVSSSLFTFVRWDLSGFPDRPRS